MKQLATSKVVLNNRLSIPGEIMESLKLSKGDLVGFFIQPDMTVLIKKVQITVC